MTGAACASSGQEGIFPSAENFIGASESLGAVPMGHTPIIESDGSVRKLPAIICVEGDAIPALAITPLLQLTGADNWSISISENNGFLGPELYLNLNSVPGLRVPLDRDGNLRISYREAPESFVSVSVVDVLEGNFESTLFDNALVLVGATAFGLDDIVPTPYSGSSPGVELQARAMASILYGNVT